jgi:phage FluMu protein Com
MTVKSHRPVLSMQRNVGRCQKCGDINYLTSKSLENLTDFGTKCCHCVTINRITLEDGIIQS